jgi:hypothetical protein
MVNFLPTNFQGANGEGDGELAMAIIEGFKLKNYRTLRDIELGKMWNTQNKVVRKLQFSEQQPLKNACFAAGRRETARTVREPTGFLDPKTFNKASRCL